jgi:hypothetical protein
MIVKPDTVIAWHREAFSILVRPPFTFRCALNSKLNSVSEEQRLCAGKRKDMVNGETQDDRGDYRQSNPHSAGLEALADGYQQ